MLLKVKDEIIRKAKQYQSLHSKWNSEDPEPYLKNGDMNRYLATLNKHGCNIPFLISQYHIAKQSIAIHLEYVSESEKYYRSLGEEEDLRTKAAGSYLMEHFIYEDMSRVRQGMDWFLKWHRTANPEEIWPAIDRDFLLVCLNHKDVLDDILLGIRNRIARQVTELSVADSNILRIMNILRAQQAFAAGKRDVLETLNRTLHKDVKALPKRVFTFGDHVGALHYDKDFFKSFAWFCEFLLSEPRRRDKHLENAGDMMLYCAIKEGLEFETSELLAIKCYMIVAQMICGRFKELESFYRHFPVVAEHLEKIADSYR